MSKETLFLNVKIFHRVVKSVLEPIHNLVFLVIMFSVSANQHNFCKYILKIGDF